MLQYKYEELRALDHFKNDGMEKIFKQFFTPGRRTSLQLLLEKRYFSNQYQQAGKPNGRSPALHHH
jgi:hypothetical protein